MNKCLTSLMPPTDISTPHLRCDHQRLNSRQGQFVIAYPWGWWHKAKVYAILYYLPLSQQKRAKLKKIQPMLIVGNTANYVKKSLYWWGKEIWQTDATLWTRWYKDQNSADYVMDDQLHRKKKCPMKRLEIWNLYSSSGFARRPVTNYLPLMDEWWAR